MNVYIGMTSMWKGIPSICDGKTLLRFINGLKYTSKLSEFNFKVWIKSSGKHAVNPCKIRKMPTGVNITSQCNLIRSYTTFTIWAFCFALHDLFAFRPTNGLIILISKRIFVVIFQYNALNNTYKNQQKKWKYQ